MHNFARQHFPLIQLTLYNVVYRCTSDIDCKFYIFQIDWIARFPFASLVRKMSLCRSFTESKSSTLTNSNSVTDNFLQSFSLRGFYGNERSEDNEKLNCVASKKKKTKEKHWNAYFEIICFQGNWDDDVHLNYSNTLSLFSRDNVRVNTPKFSLAR